jgi:hypothetical protein
MQQSNTPIAFDRVTGIGQANGRYYEPACSRTKEDKESVETVAFSPLVEDGESGLGQRHVASKMMMVVVPCLRLDGYTHPPTSTLPQEWKPEMPRQKISNRLSRNARGARRAL